MKGIYLVGLEGGTKTLLSNELLEQPFTSLLPFCDFW